MCKSEIMLRWIQALGLPTLVVGGLGLLIARWQIQTAREKLRHELYERRLAIYLAFHDLILAVSEKDTVEVELRKANAARAQAPFLLNPKVNPQIARFLAELEHEAFQIDRTAKRVRDESLWESSQERISMAGLLTQNKLAFTRRIERLATEFVPFLQLNDFRSTRNGVIKTMISWTLSRLQQLSEQMERILRR